MGTVAPFRLRNGAIYHFRDDCQFSQGGFRRMVQANGVLVMNV